MESNNDHRTPYRTGVNFIASHKELATNVRLSTAPRTVEAWVNIPAHTPPRRRVGVIIGNFHKPYYNDISRFNFEVYKNGNPRIYWRADKNEELNYVVANVNVSIGNWIHIAIVLDDKNMKLATYINGEKVDEAPAQVVIPTESPSSGMKIGSDFRGYHDDGTPEMKFNGEIADVRVWSTIRTASEIKEHYNLALQGDEAGLIGYWKLDHMNGNYFEDSSSSQNHALLYDNETSNWLEPDFVERDYTIAIIPDAQSLVRHHPAAYKQYMTWMKDNAAKLNIKLAIQVGDLVDTPHSDIEWTTSVEGMNILEGVIPCVFSPGNHDMVTKKRSMTRDTTKYNAYYSYEKYASASTFGGSFIVGKMDNTYHYFDIHGIRYMVLAMEFAPNNDVLLWANKIVAENKECRVIISTHAYMYHSGEQMTIKHHDYASAYIDDGNNGDDIWNKLVSKHEHIILVVSGHIGYDNLVVREDIGSQGNSVMQVLADAQFMQADLGMIMLMAFKEGSNDVHVNWYSVSKNKLYRPTNQFPMKVNVYAEK